MLASLIEELKSLEDSNIDDNFKEEVYEALEKVMVEFRERNMKGYVYIVYVGNNQYKIGKTADLQRRFGELKEERLVQLIRAENITKLEGELHRKFAHKRVTASQELFKLNDEDVLYIHMLPDEWEDESKIF